MIRNGDSVVQVAPIGILRCAHCLFRVGLNHNPSLHHLPFLRTKHKKKNSLSHFQSPQHSQITQFLCKQSLTIRIERLWMACNAPPRKDRFGKTLNVCSHQTCILGFVSERELFVILVQELPSTNRTYLVVVSFLYGHFSPSSTKPTCYPKSDAFKKNCLNGSEETQKNQFQELL